MTLPVEVITHAIRSTPYPERAAELIQKYESLRGRVEARKQKADAILSNAKKQVEALLKEQLCLHEVRKRHSDPSGNNDTPEECLICGELLHEKPVRFT